MEQKLSILKENQKAKIVKVLGDMHPKRRLMEFGLLSGQVVSVLSVSPLKNTFMISIRGYALALRKSILENIFVELL